MPQDELPPLVLWFEKWFRFPLWFMQRRIGRLSPYAMMDHLAANRSNRCSPDRTTVPSDRLPYCDHV